MTGSTDRSLARAVRQQLESLERAGLTHLPRSARTEHPQSAAGSSSASAVAARPTSTTQAIGASTLAPAVPETTPLSPSPVETTATNVKSLRREDRIQRLAVINEQVTQCQRCSELASTRTQTVFGVGNPEAKIVFIGEAPGADEDAQGEPFVGRAGQLLNKIIEACKLQRGDVYICNILKCRPPGNRTPAPEECANCREYLLGQLATIDPDYIVCWGSVAAQNLLGMDWSIGKMRKRFYQFGRAKVVCTYHPSYLLRNPAAKKDVWDDMKFLFADMGVTLTS